jgi:nucleoside-diphosphate-sugar epimerase
VTTGGRAATLHINLIVKILLTGPTGFIGSAFTKLALARGHEIAGLIIPAESIPSHIPAHANLNWLRGSLDDAPWEGIKRFGADVCVHTAWVTAPGVYLESPDNLSFLESSKTFLKHVNEAGTNHLVGLGTCVEYRNSQQKLSEDTSPIEPTTTYARCKNELRLALENESKQKDFDACWARVFYPYGPREHPSRLCSSIITKLSKGEKIVLKTPDSTKDYIYIDDLAAALLTVVEKKFKGTINLGTGIGITVREIAQTLATLMGRGELIEEASPPQIDPLGYVVADASRLHGLEWKSQHDMALGLEKLLISTKTDS